ncbi:carboxymuconolactone decarboxylase family protein [Dokdonella sp. MW10]|uniref:carboxymuconolactone decarboxylase family protein n=1 Tax=Dokdonella sp. MW10 TaxID=2992926 RepID=UPI003F7FEE7B
MSARLNYFRVSRDAAAKYTAFHDAVKQQPIVAELGHLVTTRASQINGCAFCVDMHVKEATIDGERALRLFHLAVWRESNLFTERERAALEWTEALTKLSDHGVPEAIYTAVREHLSEQELSDLSMLIIEINGWNRLAVAFKTVPGSADKAYGLDKANLA